MRPYGSYTNAIFTRYDQIERATDRDRATPLDHVIVDRTTLRESLFPVALVLVDDGDVTLGVTDPDGEPLGRRRGAYMDRTRGEYARVRSRFGATAGTYGIDVYADDATDYELRALVADADGPIVDETLAGSLDAGTCRSYAMEVPDDGAGQLGRAGTARVNPVVIGGTGVAVGIGAGVVGYRALRNGDRGARDVE